MKKNTKVTIAVALIGLVATAAVAFKYVNARTKIKELEADKTLGYLGGEGWLGRNIIFVQYWESFDHLEKFARSKDHSHLPAWQRFLKNVGINGDVGIWHETYEVKKGSYENIYANMPPFLLGKVGKLEKVGTSNNSARKRKG